MLAAVKMLMAASFQAHVSSPDEKSRDKCTYISNSDILITCTVSPAVSVIVFG
jgi:hypothetical protein